MCLAVSATNAQSLLLRPKKKAGATQALSLIPHPTTTRIKDLRVLKFSTETEKQEFVESINSADFEWEEKVPFSASDTSLPPSQQDFTEDPLIGNQWSILPSAPQSNSGYYSDIDVFRAWSVATGSAKVVIYVMDSGVDTRDPDMEGRVTSSFNAFNPNSPAIDDNGHGTHVASIIAARGNNKYGIRGVVPGDVQIVAGKFLNAQNQGDSETALRVINWMKQDMQARRAQDPDVKFIGSNSWGGEQYSRFLEEAMQELTQFGYLPITSAGNHGGNNDAQKYYPCNFALAANVCVAASDRYDRKTNFSGYGVNSVHVMAPGDDIYSIIPGIQNGSNYVSKYQKKKGTSQAVPHVAGVAALIWAANPDLSPSQVRDLLIESSDYIPGAENYVLSGGRINAYRAVLMAMGQDGSQADRGLYSQVGSSSKGGCNLMARSDRPLSGAYSMIMLVALTLTSVFLIRLPKRRF